MYKTIKNISNIFIRLIGNRFLKVLILSLISSLAETIGIMMMLPLFQMLGNGDNEVQNKSIIYRHAIEISNYLNLNINILNIFIFILVMFVIKGAFLYFAFLYQSKLNADLGLILKSKLFKKYSTMTYEYYSNKNTGYFLNLISEQIRITQISFGNLINFYIQIITATAYIIIALTLSFWFGIIFILIGFNIVLLFKKLNARIVKLSKLQVEDNNILYKLLIQYIQSFKYLIATAQTGHIEKHVEIIGKIIREREIRVGNASAITMALREPIAAILITVSLIIQVTVNHGEIFSILISIAFLYRGYNAVYAIQSSYQGVVNTAASVDVINEELGYVDYVKENSNKFQINNLEFKDRIIIDNITFSYSGSKNKCLDNVSIVIPKNKSIAIVGESGSGKSTLIDIIALIHTPQFGSLRVDDVEINESNKSKWREKIGYVTQDPIIFEDTIINNICLWEEKNNITDVYNAAKRAQIYDFIINLPDGFFTNVGDRGLKLSGGQRQRIALARELYRKPSLLILDEATSALDSKTEEGIAETLATLMGDLTLIIIAHRFSTIKNVDLIYVLDNGKIIEYGSFSELSNRESYFSKLMLLKTE